MKLKFTLLLASTLGFFILALSQDNITIVLDGQVDDLSSGAAAHQAVAPSSASFDVPFDVFNNGSSTQKWKVTRYQISIPNGWTDALCWGHGTDPFGGTCFSSGQMNTNPWTSPGGVSVLFDLLPGEYGKMKAQIDPADGVYGSGHYRYYITNLNGSYLDSVDLIVDYVAEVKPIKDPILVSIVPNPASDYINIQLTGADYLNLKLMDAMGNLIDKETISGSKKINTSDLRSGVYFLTFDGPSTKSFTRKVIVRH